MRRVRPANGRNGDEVMAEVYENVNHVPVRKDVFVTIRTTIDKAILMITSGHVMADKCFGIVFWSMFRIFLC